MTALTLRRYAPIQRKPNLLVRLLSADDTFRQRRAMARLTDTQLADAGLTRAQVTRDNARPIWNSPLH